MSRTIENAIIRKVDLDFERFPTFWLHCDLPIGCQGFGGIIYGDHDGNFTYAIKQILKIVGVDNWSQLQGRPIRVDREHVKIHRIGNYLKDEWFDPAAEYIHGVSRE